jgi:hypothetical protein
MAHTTLAGAFRPESGTPKTDVIKPAAPAVAKDVPHEGFRSYLREEDLFNSPMSDFHILDTLGVGF